MRLCRLISVVCAITCVLTPVAAQTRQTGFLDRVVTDGSRDRRYRVFVPPNYTPSQAWPVILFLHGASGRASDGEQSDSGLPTAIQKNTSRWPAIVVLPQLAAGTLWPGPESVIALKALDQTQREFSTDLSRVYLSGISRGGGGAWYIGYRHPARFAAVLVCCGGLLFDGKSIIPATGPPADAVAGALAKTPVWIYHGEADPVTPVAASRGIVAAFQRVGGLLKYSELPGVGHNAWDTMYSNPDVIDWLFQQRLDRRQ